MTGRVFLGFAAGSMTAISGVIFGGTSIVIGMVMLFVGVAMLVAALTIGAPSSTPSDKEGGL